MKRVGTEDASATERMMGLGGLRIADKSAK
jgi:hypothetical protein